MGGQGAASRSGMGQNHLLPIIGMYREWIMALSKALALCL